MAGPQPSASPPPAYPARRFFGLLLMTAGGLIAGLSGLCSAAVLVTVLVPLAVSGGGGGAGGALAGFFGLLGMILVFGGVPFAIGAGLFLLGRNLARAKEPAPPSVAKTFE